MAVPAEETTDMSHVCVTSSAGTDTEELSRQLQAQKNHRALEPLRLALLQITSSTVYDKVQITSSTVYGKVQKTANGMADGQQQGVPLEEEAEIILDGHVPES